MKTDVSLCICTISDQSLHCLCEETAYLAHQNAPGEDSEQTANVQADLNFHWVHMCEGKFLKLWLLSRTLTIFYFHGFSYCWYCSVVKYHLPLHIAEYSEPLLQRQYLFPKTLPLKWICLCTVYLMSRLICEKGFVLFLFPHRTYMLWIFVRIASLRQF